MAIKKQSLAIRAKNWLDYVEATYSEEIERAIKESKIYSPDSQLPVAANNRTNIVLAKEDTVGFLFSEMYRGIASTHPAILNFASYKYPGGAFLDGSTAQEEALCHESILFPVLDAFDKSFYKPNWKNLNNALYTNRAIYSEDVLFENRETREKMTVDVLTCASPNWRTAGPYKNVSKDENNRVLRERARWMNQILVDRGVDTFVAGAWGCGVFRQDPKFVARVLKEELTYPKTLIFAIPGGRNYDAFREVLEG